MAVTFQWDDSAFDDLARSPMVEAILDEYGKHVRTRARDLAKPITSGAGRGAGGRFTLGMVQAIVAEMSEDESGLFVDVGYDKKHRGFVLWWHEVGTSKFPASPHLRPALRGQ